jgi:predicted flap endonuclease-1-like 5' DNA nuclease
VVVAVEVVRWRFHRNVRILHELESVVVLGSMNNTAKNLIRISGVIVGLGAAAWALRDRLLPSPEIHDEEPPRFRDVSQAASTKDTLTDIRGVGPATADKLNNAGVTTIAEVAQMGPEDLGSAVGVSAAAAGKWIESAKTLS